MKLQNILELDFEEFDIAFYNYLVEKKWQGVPFHPLEEEMYLVRTMLHWAWAQGFVDLFVQCYTLRECYIVEATLHKLRLHQVATLFAEARSIYTDGRQDITEEEYQNIVDDLFADPKTGISYPFRWNDQQRAERFKAVEQQILDDDESEVFLIDERVWKHVRENTELLLQTTGE